MDAITSLIDKINQDCNFTEGITKSKYCESGGLNNESNKKKNCNQSYRNFLYCILDNNDIILSTAPDKDYTFPKRVVEISSQIEEKQEIFYDLFNYSKQLPIEKIQHSLQLCSKKEKLLSSIYYLNDLYQSHFVIVDIQKKEYFETCSKDYPRKYLECDFKKYSLSNTLNEGYSKTSISSLFEEDVKKSVYQQYLKPIGNYKIDDLKVISQNLDLSYYNNNKIMKKKDIYDKINLYKLCN